MPTLVPASYGAFGSPSLGRRSRWLRLLPRTSRCATSVSLARYLGPPLTVHSALSTHRVARTSGHESPLTDHPVPFISHLSCAITTVLPSVPSSESQKNCLSCSSHRLGHVETSSCAPGSRVSVFFCLDCSQHQCRPHAFSLTPAVPLFSDQDASIVHQVHCSTLANSLKRARASQSPIGNSSGHVRKGVLAGRCARNTHTCSPSSTPPPPPPHPHPLTLLSPCWPRTR